MQTKIEKRKKMREMEGTEEKKGEELNQTKEERDKKKRRHE